MEPMIVCSSPLNSLYIRGLYDLHFFILSWIKSFLLQVDMRKSQHIWPSIKGVISTATTITTELFHCCDCTDGVAMVVNTAIVIITVAILTAALAAFNASARFLSADSFKKSIAFSYIKVISAARIILLFRSIHFLFFSSHWSLTRVVTHASGRLLALRVTVR
jgi:hypothetical protein